MNFRMFGGALAATTVCLIATMSGCASINGGLSSGNVAKSTVAALDFRSDLQSFSWTKSADDRQSLTFAYKDVKTVGTYLSDAAQKSLAEVTPAFEAECQKKGREAAIDFVSGMAIREMRDAAEYEALKESVGVLVKRRVLPMDSDFETIDEVKSRIGESSIAYRTFENDFIKRKAAKLKALDETRAAQKAQLVNDTVSDCMKPLLEKEEEARAWQNITNVTQKFEFKGPVDTTTKPTRAEIVLTWPDGRSVEKEVDAARLYEALLTGTSLTDFLKENEAIARLIVDEE